MCGLVVVVVCDDVNEVVNVCVSVLERVNVSDAVVVKVTVLTANVGVVVYMGNESVCVYVTV